MRGGGGLWPSTVRYLLKRLWIMNLLLYFITVLIWGTTWIAIKWQVGVVAPPVSIAFRFWIAALAMFVLMRLLRRSVKAPREAWPLLVGQGVALFCINFLCFYYAEQIVPSGLVAVVFSTAPLFNAINGRVFLGRPLQPSAIVGAVLGLVGIVCLFAPQMAGHTGDRTMWLGLAIALIGTMSFSAVSFSPAFWRNCRPSATASAVPFVVTASEGMR